MKLVGFIMIVLGVVLGLYMGVWICFIGGIIDILEVMQSMAKEGYTIEAGKVAFAILKICASTLIGWVAAALLLIPGFAMVQ